MKTDKYMLLIKGDTWLEEVQSTFTSIYPFLKLEFNTQKKSGTNKNNGTYGIKVGDLANILQTVEVNVEPNRTIREVEQDFAFHVGLPVIISRKSGNIWNRISLTDSWTLENQNEAGQFICSQMETDTVG